MNRAFYCFTNVKNTRTPLSTALLITGVLALAACGGGGGSSSGLIETQGPGAQPAGSQSIDGGGVKGPLAGAIVTIYNLDTTAADFKGSAVGNGTTDAQARIQDLSLPFPLSPPYILEFTSDASTVDITTGQSPVITIMRTVVTQDRLDSGEQIYATPLTTMAVDIAVRNPSSVDAATFEAALDDAASQVKSTVGFGIGADVDIFDTPPLIDSTTDTVEEQAAVAAYRTAVEALTAVVFEMQRVSSAGDTDAVLAELAKDLADGVIDGNVDGATSAVYEVAALDVLAQDPATLIIPNTNISVADIELELQTETAITGETIDTTALDNIEVASKPAETNADIDSDGVLNDEDAFPENPEEQLDTDNDNIGNNADTDDDNDGWADELDDFPLDAALFLDPAADRDGDTVANGDDVCPLISDPDQADTDNDGVGDACTDDADGDGVVDSIDNCPSKANPDQLNTDAQLVGGDDLGDVCDDDDDGDGVPDANDLFILDASESTDLDGDGIGDNSDPDKDGDGLLNDEEILTDPLLWDTDGDGFPDGIDLFPNDPTEALDTDGDGSPDNTDVFPADPEESVDTDGDTIGDNGDNCPLIANVDQTNTDGAADGGDACDSDDDNDGVSDEDEAILGTDPLDADSDDDGVIDGSDDFPTDASETVDTDNDGTGDESDNCPSVANSDQADANQDGLGDACSGPPAISGIYLIDFSSTSGDEWDGSACTPVIDSGSEFIEIKQIESSLIVSNDGEEEEDGFDYDGSVQVDGSFSFGGADVDFTDSFSGVFDPLAGTFTGVWTEQTNTNSSPVCTATFSVSGTLPQAVSEQAVSAAGGAVWIDSESFFDGSTGSDQLEFEYGIISESLEAQFSWDESAQAWLDSSAGSVDDESFLLADGSIATADDIIIITGYVSGGETAIAQLTDAGTPVTYEIFNVELEEYDLQGKAMLDILDGEFDSGLSESAVFGAGAVAYFATITATTDNYTFWCDNGWDDWFIANLDCDNIVAIDQVENPPASGNYDPVPATVLTDLIVNGATETVDPTGTGGTPTPGLWSGRGFDGTNDFDINAYLVSDDGTVGGSAGTGGTVEFHKVIWQLDTSTDTNITTPYTVVNRGGVEIIEWTTPDSIQDLGDLDDDEEGRILFVDSVTESAGFGDVVRMGSKTTAGTVQHELMFNTTALEQFKIEFSFTSPAPLPSEFVDATANGVIFTDDNAISTGNSFGVRGSGIFREWETSTHEYGDFYVFDATGNGGRWVRQEFLLADDSTTASIAEDMTWLIDGGGNLVITITSSGSVHQIAMNNFNDSLRPDVLVVIDDVFDSAHDGSSVWPVLGERLISQAQYEADLTAKVDLVDFSTLAGDYHYSFNPDEQLHLNLDGTFDEFFGDGSGPVLDGSGTWTVDATNDFFTLDWCDPDPAGCGDEDIVALESVVADSGDIDSDSDTTENVYTVAGWFLIDSITGLGSMYRDQLLLIVP